MYSVSSSNEVKMRELTDGLQFRCLHETAGAGGAL